MKKRIIALASAFAMLAPMTLATVANAKVSVQDTGVTIVYNAKESTANEAVVDVYVKGYEEKIVSNISLPLIVNSDYVETSEMIAEAAKATPDFSKWISTQIAGATLGYNSRYGFLQVGASSTGDITWTETEPLATYRLPIKADTVTTKVALDVYKNSINIGGDRNANSTIYSGKVADSILPYATAVTVNEQEDDPAGEATYYVLESAPDNDNETPYWYGRINDAPVKHVATTSIANIAADTNVKLGLVYGSNDLTDVKLVWE